MCSPTVKLESKFRSGWRRRKLAPIINDIGSNDLPVTFYKLQPKEFHCRNSIYATNILSKDDRNATRTPQVVSAIMWNLPLATKDCSRHDDVETGQTGKS